MSRGVILACHRLLIVACLSVISTSILQANDASLLSGSYEVVRQADTAGEVRVTLQIRLSNRGVRNLQIQRMTLWDFSHPARGGTQACSFLLRAAGSANVTEEFTVPRAEYELWKRGTRPRLVLEVVSNGRPSTAVLRLDHLSTRKVN